MGDEAHSVLIPKTDREKSELFGLIPSIKHVMKRGASALRSHGSTYVKTLRKLVGTTTKTGKVTSTKPSAEGSQNEGSTTASQSEATIKQDNPERETPAELIQVADRLVRTARHKLRQNRVEAHSMIKSNRRLSLGAFALLGGGDDETCKDDESKKECTAPAD